MGYTLRTMLRQSREDSKAIKYRHSKPCSPSFLPPSPLAQPPLARLLSMEELKVPADQQDS